MSKKSSPVLLIRINCVPELTNTSEAVDVVRQSFPDNPLVAISSAGSEGRLLLDSDPRLESIRIVTPNERSIFKKLPALIKSLGLIGGTRATVIFYGTTDGLNYSRHVLSGLLFGGVKYVIGPDRKLVKVASGRGAAAVLASVKQALVDSVAIKYLLIRYPDAVVARPKTLPWFKSGDRVLVVKLDSIGDVVASLPIIQALSRTVETPVDLLVRAEFAPLLKSLPFVNKIHTYAYVHMTAFEASTHRLVENLRRLRYQTAVDLTGNSLTARLFIRFSGSGVRIGLSESSLETVRTGVQFVQNRIQLSSDSDYTVRAQTTAQSLGIADKLQSFKFTQTVANRSMVEEKLRSRGISAPFAALHMRPSTAYKSWSVDSFAKASDYLTTKHGLHIVLTGSSKDRDYNEQMKSLAAYPEKIYNLAGEIALEELPCVYDCAVITVTVDTGPAHIAGATSCALVVLGYHSPYGKAESLIQPDPLESASHPGRPLHAISVASVLSAIDLALQGRQ